jgi:hypothetical protein
MENKLQGHCFGCGKKIDREPNSLDFECDCGVAFRIHIMSWSFNHPLMNETTDDSDREHEDTTSIPMIKGNDGIMRPVWGKSPLEPDWTELVKMRETLANVVVNGNLMLSHLKSMLQIHDPQLIDTLPRKIEEDPKNARIRS